METLVTLNNNTDNTNNTNNTITNTDNTDNTVTNTDNTVTNIDNIVTNIDNTVTNNNQSIIDDDGFIKIATKVKKIKNKIPEIMFDRNFIITNENMNNVFKKYDPFSAMLYGSYARNNHGSSSNINILILWNYKQRSSIDSYSIQIKKELFDIYKKQIQILSMIVKKNNLNNTNYFMTNIHADTIIIYGNVARDNIFNSEIYKEYK